MSYAMPPQQPTKRRTPWVLIVGGVILLVSLVLCAFGGLTSFGTMSDLTDKTAQTTQVIDLGEGDQAAAWSETSGATCTATGPAGPVSDSAKGDASVSWNGKELERVMLVEADQAGTYTFTCSAPVVVGDNLSTAGLVAAVIGSLLCCLSVVVVVVGLVLWLMGRNRR